MSWNAKWSLATNQNVKALLEYPTVANRADLPARLFSKTDSTPNAAGSFPGANP